MIQQLKDHVFPLDYNTGARNARAVSSLTVHTAREPRGAGRGHGRGAVMKVPSGQGGVSLELSAPHAAPRATRRLRTEQGRCPFPETRQETGKAVLPHCPGCPSPGWRPRCPAPACPQARAQSLWPCLGPRPSLSQGSALPRLPAQPATSLWLGLSPVLSLGAVSAFLSSSRSVSRFSSSPPVCLLPPPSPVRSPCLSPSPRPAASTSPVLPAPCRGTGDLVPVARAPCWLAREAV